MTDNEIIEALERMTEEDPEGFSSEILDLIKRQKQAIADERAKGDICAEVIKRQDKEIERLKGWKTFYELKNIHYFTKRKNTYLNERR